MNKIKERKLLATQVVSRVWLNFKAWKNAYISFLTTFYEGNLFISLFANQNLT